jgi:hypothetical protein
MALSRRICVASAAWCLLLLGPPPAWSQSGPQTAPQSEQEDVPLIMLKPQGASALSGPRLRRLYAAIKGRSQRAKGVLMPLTKTEVWTVPKENVEGVRQAAARHGVIMSRLSASWNHIFHKAPADTKVNGKQMAMLERARNSRATMGVGMMASPRAPMVEFALTKDASAEGPQRGATRVTVALGDDTSLSVRRTSVEVRSDMCIWRGVVEETGAPATIMWWPGGKMAGTLQHQGRLYSIRHLGGELIAMVEMGEDRMPQEHASLSLRRRVDDPTLRDDPLVQQGDASALRPKLPPPANAEPGIGTKAAVSPDQDRGAPPSVPAGNVVIDVIVAYTKKAASNYADVKRELIDLAIEEGNESFRVSSLGQVQLRLVHAYETDYVEEGAAHFDHVWRFADKGDGYMDEIHALRDKYKADVAILIVDDAQGCGLATRVFADAEEAFAVVHHECAASTYSLAHEIGHLIGARHDLNLDKMMTPFAYGHGYVNGTKWRDIMSYKESCGGCPRLPVWSSPTVLVRGERAGTPDLDNARVIREQAARVAAFR